MVDSVQDWRVKLMQAHPRLFGIPFGRPDAAQGYPARPRRPRHEELITVQETSR